MRIGIDFDNTLVCYDQLFWALARDRGLIGESIPRRKDAVRDHLRASGLEPVWTALQGEAYGPMILEALPFFGVREALTQFRQRNWTVFVISHKTRTPFAGPAYDLHEAARNWLDGHGLLAGDVTNLTPDRVFLELTVKDKLRRICEAGCDCFIDDLPEILNDPSFPTDVRRILFDPHRQYERSEGVEVFHDWSHVVQILNSETS